MRVDRPTALVLRVLALGYLAVLLLVPVGLVFYRTFEHGVGAVWDSVTTPAAVHAFWLTIEIAAIAVPLNTIFGVVVGLAIVRKRFPGKGLVNAFVDLPLALSPVVVGLSLFLLYGRTGWFGPWLQDHGVQMLFALPAMVLATVFVSVPYVAREVIKAEEIVDFTPRENVAERLARRFGAAMAEAALKFATTSTTTVR